MTQWKQNMVITHEILGYPWVLSLRQRGAMEPKRPGATAKSCGVSIPPSHPHVGHYTRSTVIDDFSSPNSFQKTTWQSHLL